MDKWYVWLGSDYFRVILTVVSTGLGIWVKSESRHPENQSISKEDLAVGVPLIQTACVSFVLLVTQKAIQLHTALLAKQGGDPSVPGPNVDQLMGFMTVSGLRLAALMILLFGTASLVRRVGWESKTDIRILPGVAIPLVIGMACLYAVIWSGQ